MKFSKTKLNGLFVIKLEPFQDERGKFFRVYCENELNDIGHNKKIVQINQSLTKKKGTIRGMHFQYPPKAEIKMVRCLKGSVFDVAIDLRIISPTFLKWHGEILTEDNMMVLYIPEGFAHGFQTLENDSELLYLHTELYNSHYEGGITYNDPKINIKWPLELTDISERDKSFKLIGEDFQGILL